MDGESIVHDLFDSVPRSDGRRCFVEDYLNAALPNILPLIPGAGDVHGAPFNCQMDVLGRHLLHLIRVLSHFAGLLVNESSISTYTDQMLEELVEEDDGSLLDYVDTKIEALKSIIQIFGEASKKCTQVWKSSYIAPPPHLPAFPVWPSKTNHSPNVQRSPSTPSPIPQGNTVETASSSEMESSQLDRTNNTSGPAESQDFQSGLLGGGDGLELSPPDRDQLRARGKGTYTCPHGLSCKKGGVQDGMLKVFVRNSDFRAHLMKHEKQYKCDLPGCPNTKGFSRPDQLERHQRLVKHDASIWREVDPR